MNKKLLIIIAVSVVAAVGLVAAVLLFPKEQTVKPQPAPQSQPGDTTDSAEQAPTITKAQGRYVPYTTTLIAETGYDQTILFFHAAWCPECRAFEQAINDSTIPDGVQIIKVDYDNAVDLREMYGVTLQSTFVSVKNNGEQVAKWVGYGKDKSVKAILENL